MLAQTHSLHLCSFGFPIHRLMGGKHSSVVRLHSALGLWLTLLGSHDHAAVPEENVASYNRQSYLFLSETNQDLN